MYIDFIFNVFKDNKSNISIICKGNQFTYKSLINNIEKFLNDEKIGKDFDPSIGCSIKWK